jgi:hypothetical protein
MICKSEPKNPYNYPDGNKVVGPTYDMYIFLAHSINNNLIPENIYKIQTVNINIKIGNSIEHIKKINLYYFPNDIEYTINVKLDNNKFECYIENNILFVKNKENIAWDELYECDIIIKYHIDI